MRSRGKPCYVSVYSAEKRNAGSNAKFFNNWLPTRARTWDLRINSPSEKNRREAARSLAFRSFDWGTGLLISR